MIGLRSLSLALVVSGIVAQETLPPNPGFPACSVCGDGLKVTLPDVELSLLPGSTQSCSQVEAAGLLGYIDASFCPILPSLVLLCGCTEGEATVSPVFVPTAATEAPAAMMPITAMPITMSPVSMGPVTGMPVTMAPITAAPTTAAPVTSVSTPMPTTASPSAAPVTAAPVVPTTPAPTSSAVSAGLSIVAALAAVAVSM